MGMEMRANDRNLKIVMAYRYRLQLPEIKGKKKPAQFAG
jgi:hypothetical protein